MMARDLGDEANAAFQQRAFDREDHQFAALVSLHARCCRASLEVLALLKAGFPVGALGIWRTVYEYAVTARVLGQHPGHAQRYLLHEVIQRAADARHLQTHASVLGIEPLDEEDYEALQDERGALLATYGKGFASDYGWATDLMMEGVGGFRGLEQLAGLEYMRPQYRLASHGVHSGARGGALNVFEQRGQRMLSVGPQNVGLSDPGHGTLLALAQATAALLSVLPEDELALQRAVALKALHLLTERAREAFLTAELSLEGDQREMQCATVVDRSVQTCRYGARASLSADVVMGALRNASP